MRTAKLGVVFVMVIVRASPNAAGTERENSKDSHEGLGQTGMRQYRVVLLIVLNHEKPKNEQPCENTANNFTGKMEIPESSCTGGRQKKRSGENAPPTSHCGIDRIGFGRHGEFFSGSHGSLLSTLAKSCPLSITTLP